jgi:hypothetical protein
MLQSIHKDAVSQPFAHTLVRLLLAIPLNLNMSLAPPFTQETAHAKVKKAQDLWNTQ